MGEDASALVVLVSNSLMVPPGKDTPVPSHSHSMDAGAAWASLALQATLSGWYTHGMVGFDMERAFAELGLTARVPGGAGDRDRPLGDKSSLPEAMAARETPNDRMPLSQIVMEGVVQGQLSGLPPPDPTGGSH